MPCSSLLSCIFVINLAPFIQLSVGGEPHPYGRAKVQYQMCTLNDTFAFSAKRGSLPSVHSASKTSVSHPDIYSGGCSQSQLYHLCPSKPSLPSPLLMLVFI
ncbi:hypothetical protein KIL84_011186 [Mauremys mutica]|uniref:Secreted protein n=1 Tax=Mauremys mutica TaxID=74926 RepID=A0A9D3XBK0_9SAUR|nr:hypothetical protein KIL84_011186 [Mauremys mutica]